MNTTSHRQVEPVSADIARLLKILTQNVNADPYAAVREYVANAHDACVGRPSPAIRVWGDRGTIHIADNGCGMTRDVILQAFTRIAGRHENSASGGVGMFGLGVLTAFMISNRLVVQTRSASEPNGWALEWSKDQTSFAIEPLERADIGTTATFYLSEDYGHMSSNSELREYVANTFGLLEMPIYVGLRDAPANRHHRFLAEERGNPEPRLLTSFESRDLLRQYCRMDVDVAYGAFLEDGTRIILGIPSVEFAPLDHHRVEFFSRGVWVCGNIRAFFPENLTFVVGFVDHPNFSLQIDREGFVMDRTFTRLRESIEGHIMRFLELLAAHDSRAIRAVLRTHHTMLLAHSRRQPRLRDLLRRHYRFSTNMGLKTWDELVALAPITRGAGGAPERTIYVLSDDGGQLHVLPVAAAKGYPVVLASGGERALAEEVAKIEGVGIVDAGVLIDGAALSQVPEPFRVLAAMLAAPLRRHRVGNVGFFHLPGQNELPVMFQIVTSLGRTVRSSSADVTEKSKGEVLLHVDALLLNVAHPLIESLAGQAQGLDAAALHRAADALYCIAVLNSPMDNAAAEASELITGFLVEVLAGRSDRRPPAPVGEAHAKCFVALPYRKEFAAVWRAVQAVLSSEPYNWRVIRADEDVRETAILSGLAFHIATSRRFVADVSSENPNVMLELGMMLQRDPRATLILTDTETFEKLPVDLRGQICLVYPRELRGDEAALRAWFAENVRRHPEFTSMRGTVVEAALDG